MSDRTYLEAWQQAHREAGADMDRVICERDEARAERDALAAQLADRDAEVVSLQETCEELHAEAKAWEREAAALAAQLEAARQAAAEVQRHWQYGHQTYLGSGVAALIRTLAAPVEPQPEPDGIGLDGRCDECDESPAPLPEPEPT